MQCTSYISACNTICITWVNLRDKLLASLDDVIILGKESEDHLTNLRTTFARFKKYNLKLKPKKCSLFHTMTLFLGRIVSEESVSINPEKVVKVTKWPVPKVKVGVLRPVQQPEVASSKIWEGC